MATTTPNFGWAVPTSTDLVKDGAVAIETLGDSIDASLLDLKGGTTGQVLAKASGTDMDFSWTTPTDQTPLTTQGDLFTFTTVDARLGVGTNGQVLQADSAEATGLKWATPSGFGTWASWTPSLTASVTNPTLGTGSVTSGRYVQNGKVVTAVAYFAFGTSGVSAGSGGYRCSLPVNAVSYTAAFAAGSGAFIDVSAANGYILIPQMETTTYFTFRVNGGGYGDWNASNPVAPSNSDQIHLMFQYEVA
jgi:hypothetical protein